MSGQARCLTHSTCGGNPDLDTLNDRGEIALAARGESHLAISQVLKAIRRRLPKPPSTNYAFRKFDVSPYDLLPPNPVIYEEVRVHLVQGIAVEAEQQRGKNGSADGTSRSPARG